MATTYGFISARGKKETAWQTPESNRRTTLLRLSVTRTLSRSKIRRFIPGIGPVTATALIAAIGNGSAFRRGRDLAAWVGMVPREYSTGGKQKLLGISKRGNQKFSISLPNPSDAGDIIVAGDGYAYLAYSYVDSSLGHVHVRVVRVNSSGASEQFTIFDSTLSSNPDVFPFNGWNALISNADNGVLLSWWDKSQNQQVPHWTTISSAGVTDSNGPVIPAEQQEATAPVLQLQDGSFVGVAFVGDKFASFDQLIPYMVGFDASGNVLWSVANEQPQIATQDGRIIGHSGIIYDHTGSATGQVNTAEQSWTGNEYASSSGALASLSLPPQFPLPDSFWPQAGGNPSGNGTAFVQCPCLLQSAGSSPLPASDHNDQSRYTPAAGARLAAASLKTYVILEGDPGLNIQGHQPHNVGNLFHLAAGTEQDRLNGQANLAGSPIRVSSVQDVANQLTGNGPITGGVVFFGHGFGIAYQDQTWTSGLAPGEQAGASTNITRDNVTLLSNTQLSTDAIITLHACYAGLGSRRYSIAQLIATQLQRVVYAPVAGTFFSIDPNSRFTGSTAPPLPNQKPIYLIQDGGVAFRRFSPF